MDLTRKLFFKIDKLNWDQILTEAKSNAPKRKDFGTTLNPGTKNTDSYDTQISRYQIDRTLGTDLWVKVNISREHSYDKWSSRARNAGIHGEGWMKLISMTDIYYTFYFVNYNALRRDSGSIYNVPHVYDKEVMDYVMGDEIRLKKEYIHPVMPLQYKTTAELTNEYDDYNGYDDDEE